MMSSETDNKVTDNKNNYLFELLQYWYQVSIMQRHLAILFISYIFNPTCERSDWTNHRGPQKRN